METDRRKHNKTKKFKTKQGSVENYKQQSIRRLYETMLTAPTLLLSIVVPIQPSPCSCQRPKQRQPFSRRLPWGTTRTLAGDVQLQNDSSQSGTAETRSCPPVRVSFRFIEKLEFRRVRNSNKLYPAMTGVVVVMFFVHGLRHMP